MSSSNTELAFSFVDQKLISYFYSSCSSCSCWGDTLQKKPKALLFQIGLVWSLAGLF